MAPPEQNSAFLIPWGTIFLAELARAWALPRYFVASPASHCSMVTSMARGMPPGILLFAHSEIHDFLSRGYVEWNQRFSARGYVSMSTAIFKYANLSGVTHCPCPLLLIRRKTR